ncbi:MAG: FAD-binding protein, partial [Oscillospiraceae bacterium]|nr:FAD-binding protein [Oscillospiraceae bacterium]
NQNLLPPALADLISASLKDSHRPGGQSLKLLVTVSGLMIDENQQVLDTDFEPIPGLFVTGNCSGCRFGFQYTTSVPGQSISIAQTLGREVGKYLAEQGEKEA